LNEARAITREHFALPHHTRSAAEALVRTAATLSYLGYLNKRVPCIEFAYNKTFQLVHEHSQNGSMDGFYDRLRSEVHMLITDHLTYHAKDAPRVAAYEILAQVERHQWSASFEAAQLIEAHLKLLAP
jgi:hypothetical protein